MANDTNPTARVEVSTSALLRWLGDAKAFASTDDHIPPINGLAFEFAGEDLLAIGTDRYTLGVSRLPVGQVVAHPKRFVRLADIADLEKVFKPARGMDPALALEFGTEGLAVETTATLDGHPTQRIGVPWSEQTSPVPWRSILDGQRGREHGPVCGAFNPDFLARFVKVQHNKSEPVLIWPTEPNKPWRVTVGDYFSGLIMPARIPGEAAEWIPAETNSAVESDEKAA